MAPKTYEKVTVLLMKWANDDMGVHIPEDHLRQVLERAYNFEVLEYLFDAQDFSLADMDALRRGSIKFIRNFIQRYDGPKSLMIYVYSGHGHTEWQEADCQCHGCYDNGQSGWDSNENNNWGDSSRSRYIQCSSRRKGFNPYYIHGHKDAAREECLDWVYLSEQITENSKGDVLYILDSCYAGQAAITYGPEVLAASSRDSQAEANLESCFTKALTRVLEYNNGQPASVAAILAALHRDENHVLNCAPAHIVKRGGDSIVLQRLRKPGIIEKYKIGHVLGMFSLLAALIATSSSKTPVTSSKINKEALGAATCRSTLIKNIKLPFKLSPTGILLGVLGFDRVNAMYPLLTYRNICTLLVALSYYRLHVHADDWASSALIKCVKVLRAVIMNPKPPDW